MSSSEEVLGMKHIIWPQQVQVKLLQHLRIGITRNYIMQSCKKVIEFLFKSYHSTVVLESMSLFWGLVHSQFVSVWKYSAVQCKKSTVK